MYIAERYWNCCIGERDDSYTLTTYLADKQKREIPLSEIFSDIGLDRLNGNFRQHEEPLTAVLRNIDSDYEEPYVEFYYAIDLIAALAAILLECKVSGSVNLSDLSGDGADALDAEIRITATPEEHRLLCSALTDFAANPFAYDVSEMESEGDTLEAAAICKTLCRELYGDNV